MSLKLYFFTASFPYGVHPVWIANEIELLRNKFSEITIVPYSFYGSEINVPIHNTENITVEKPFFTKPVFIKPKTLIYLFSPRLILYLKEFFSQKVFSSKAKMISFLDYVSKTELMLKTDVVKDLLHKKDKDNIVLYFYWGIGCSYLVPYLKEFNKIIIRFHGFDLYEERNNSYIPFRKQQLANMKFGVFISNHGMNYLKAKYKDFEQKYKLFRLGVKSKGSAIQSSDNVFRIVSCSSIITLKRVHLILGAIKKLTINVEWTHLGGGELFEALKNETSDLPDNLKVNLTGQIDSAKVLDFYVDKMVDVFVNVSTTEGVPVSIMEAFSASIPVIATNVGGTHEIVDNSVGMLIPSEISERNLADYLLAFYSLPFEEKMKLRVNAKRRFEECCNARKLNENFSDFIVNI